MAVDDVEFREFFASQYARLCWLGLLLTGDQAEAEELARRRWADLVALGGAPSERPGRLRPQGAGQPAPLAAAPGRVESRFLAGTRTERSHPPGPRRGRALAVRGVLAVVVALALAAGIPRLLTGRTAGRLGDLAGLERGRHLCHRLAYHRPPEQACPRAGS